MLLDSGRFMNPALEDLILLVDQTTEQQGKQVPKLLYCIVGVFQHLAG